MTNLLLQCGQLITWKYKYIFVFKSKSNVIEWTWNMEKQTINCLHFTVGGQSKSALTNQYAFREFLDDHGIFFHSKN